MPNPARNPSTETPITPVVRPLLTVRHGLRVFSFFSLVVLLTGLATLLFADLLWRTGWSSSRTALLVLFVPLFFFAALGGMNGLYGFVLRRGIRYQAMQNSPDWASQDIGNASAAIVFPIYNEDVERVFEGLRATYLSLQKTGKLENFDFFVLSDSTRSEKWVDEEKHWYDIISELGALGRIYYRRRVLNEDKKSGNIRDFLRSWGTRYRYFMILDADSVMRGDTILSLVKMMEANADVGLIQSVPALVSAESLFGRMQQFANRFYAPIFITGMDYWSQDFGNYWGHNAIIRTEPFMQYCDLPRLPGRKPFGGHILSHDFVEAALLLKANWKVWIAYNLGGSYEEAPQGLIENAQRDRRWCQGNLQHGLVLFARGLRGISRTHLVQGIFGYLGGPFWFAFLVTFNVMWMRHKISGLSQITVHSWSPWLDMTGSQEALLVFLICMGILLLPRALALVDIALDPPRRREFGGLRKTVASTFCETCFSTLHAPLQMLWNLQFVTTILLGINSGWEPQKRTADGTTWGYALRHTIGHTLVGLVWGGLIWWLAPAIFFWFVPVLAGLLLAVPLAVFTSRSSWGRRAREMGLFLTPEETFPPEELQNLRARLAAETTAETVFATGSNIELKSELAEIILDPYANAIHVSLLRESRLNPDYDRALTQLGVGTSAVRELGEKVLAEGVDALKTPEKMLVMSDADTMSWLHRQVWLRPRKTVSASWRLAIRHYTA